MADSYSFVKGGKLKLKGQKSKSHKKHKKHKSAKRSQDEMEEDNTEDVLRHGGWWEVKSFEDIHSSLAIEIGHMKYIQALDNGLFSLAESQTAGEGPSPEQIFTSVKLGDSKLALKSGFDKYLSVDAKNRVVGRSDAIATREQFEPVFQDGKLALLGCNSCFLSVQSDGGISCSSPTASTDEHIKFRCCAKREKKSKTEEPAEERGSAKDAEVNYVKKFQSFQDRRLRVTTEDKSALKVARGEGNLHEVMLDRREKMKSDRYCK